MTPLHSPRLRSSAACILAFVLLIALGSALGQDRSPASPAGVSQDQGLKPILNYISSAWDTLTRSMTECKSVVDPKITAAPVMYLPAGFAEPPALQTLSGDCNVRVEHLAVDRKSVV